MTTTTGDVSVIKNDPFVTIVVELGERTVYVDLTYIEADQLGQVLISAARVDWIGV